MYKAALGILLLFCVLWLAPLWIVTTQAAPTCGSAPSTPTTTNLGLCKTDAGDGANFLGDYHANLEEIDTSAVGVRTPAQGGTGTGTVFTSGSIPFAGASGIYAQDNANFFWDDTLNRLGLGITTPSSVIEARSDVATETAAIFSGASAQSANVFRVTDNASNNRLLVDENYAVGVWVDNPLARLHVFGAIDTHEDIALIAEESRNSLQWIYSANSTFSALGNLSGGPPFICLHCAHDTSANTWHNDNSGIAGTSIINQAGQFEFYINPTATADDNFGTGITPSLTVASGLVGVNTAAPAEALDVIGKIQLSDLTAPGADPLCWDGTGASTVGDCTSLRKYKKNIADMPEELGLPTVLKLRPRVFTWIEAYGGKEDLGFVAEEVEQVEPLVASYTDKGLSGVKFDHYTAALTKAIQQQQALIEQLTTRITVLEEALATQ